MFLTGKNSEAHLHISASLKRFSPLGQGQAELEKKEMPFPLVTEPAVSKTRKERGGGARNR